MKEGECIDRETKHQSQREAEEMRASGKYVATKVKKTGKGKGQ